MALSEIAASPKVSGSREPRVPASVAGIVELLIEPTEVFVRATGASQDEPFQLRIEITGTVPPFARSYVISLSPTVLTGVTPFVEQLVGFALVSQNFWFSSKSMFVVPCGLCTRVQKSS